MMTETKEKLPTSDKGGQAWLQNIRPTGERPSGVGVSKDEALAVARERHGEQFVLARMAEKDAELIFMIGLERYRPCLKPDGFYSA